ncbi:MAG: hypothetical protein J6T10_09440 [Methanobrevibacter sp.]|nr:hypothetical protein [Methanobrevibacter sp.]
MGAIPPALFNLYTMNIEELASAVLNDIEAGLVGLHENITLSQDQLEDEVVAERERVILE